MLLNRLKQNHSNHKETKKSSSETFYFDIRLNLEGNWMMGLTSLTVENFYFKMTEEIFQTSIGRE